MHAGAVHTDFKGWVTAPFGARIFANARSRNTGVKRGTVAIAATPLARATAADLAGWTRRDTRALIRVTGQALAGITGSTQTGRAAYVTIWTA